MATLRWVGWELAMNTHCPSETSAHAPNIRQTSAPTGLSPGHPNLLPVHPLTVALATLWALGGHPLGAPCSWRCPALSRPQVTEAMSWFL